MAEWFDEKQSILDSIDLQVAKKRAAQQVLMTPDVQFPTDQTFPTPAKTPQFQPFQETEFQIPTNAPPPRYQLEQSPATEYITPTNKALKKKVPELALPTEPELALKITPDKSETPFWQRALDVFNAPFNWTQQQIVNPALSLIGTGVGIVPDVERNEGEDFWEWKKRSWKEWDAPGVDMNMPWGKWRVDAKGIAELAPWFLIPGAGQIGGGLIKGAGFLGRAAPLAKGLGTAIKYSPWGVVEATAGKAIGATVKGVAKGLTGAETKLEEKFFGKITQKDIDPSVKKFNQVFSEAVAPQLKENRALRSQQLKVARAKIAQVEADFKAGKISEDDYSKALSAARKGEAGFGTVSPENLAPITGDDIRAIKRIIEEKLTGFEKVRAFDAFDKLTLGIEESGIPKGTIVGKSEYRVLSKALGSEFQEILSKATQRPSTGLEKILDVANLPRATLASWDFSATLRQGLILGLLHPTSVPKAFARQIKAFASEKLALEADDILRSNPLFNEFEKLGGYIAPISKGAKLASREESFMSKFAENLPGVRRSERAYLTYLNELRMAAYESTSATWRAMGAAEKDLRGLAQFINAASGRGNIPRNLENYSPLLSATFFSPRLQLSRLQLPAMMLSKNPYVRKEATRAAVRFLGTGVGLLTLFDLAGGKVEKDPRSADFGKIKIGETRFDIWTGYLQYARFMARMLTGETKTTFGNVTPKGRMDEIGEFLQSKASPSVGLLVDLFRGETYEGEPLFDDTTGFITNVGKKVLPLTLQDMMTSMEEYGVNGLTTAIPASLGVGTITYANKFAQAKDRVARQEGYENWEEVDALTQRKLERTSPILQRAALEFDEQVMGTQWGDWRLAGQAIEEQYKDGVSQASAEYQKTLNGVIFREKVDASAQSRRDGYKAREKDKRFEEIVARQSSGDTLESLVKLGPERLAIKIYQDAMYGDDMTDEFGNYLFDEATKREQMFVAKYGQDTLDYIKDYMGAKWDEPQDLKELRMARTVLKPYWQIQDEVERIRGKAKNVYQQKVIDSLTQRLRKNMRIRNQQVNYYYQKFYVAP